MLCYVILTYIVSAAMYHRYSNRKSLLGFELLNEPSQDMETGDHGTLEAFYLASYDIVRKHSPTALVVFNELYQPFYKSWRHFAREPDFYNVVSTATTAIMTCMYVCAWLP
jgi:hypothetical protein